MHIEHAALIVRDYEEAIAFFVDALGFELVEDTPATTNDGRPKRWVVVKPPGARTGLLPAQADGEDQVDGVGSQYAGRVGLFLRVDDFDDAYRTDWLRASKASLNGRSRSPLETAGHGHRPPARTNDPCRSHLGDECRDVSSESVGLLPPRRVPGALVHTQLGPG